MFSLNRLVRIRSGLTPEAAAIATANIASRTRGFFNLKKSSEKASMVVRRERQLADDRCDTHDLFLAMNPDSQASSYPGFRIHNFFKMGLPDKADIEITEGLDRALKQSFNEDCFNLHGSEMSAAIFILSYGGRVKLHDIDGWLNSLAELEKLMQNRRTILHVSHIDFNGKDFVYEGLENILGLSRLESVNVSSCPYIDDFCLARLASVFWSSLKHIDISSCPMVTARGVECLVHFRNLQSAKLAQLSHIEDLPFICLLVTDVLTQLDIEGVDYMCSPPPSPLLQSASSGVL